METNESIQRQTSAKIVGRWVEEGRIEQTSFNHYADMVAAWIAKEIEVEEVKDEPKGKHDCKCDKEGCDVDLTNKDVDYSEKYAQKFKDKYYCFKHQQEIWAEHKKNK